MIPTNGSVHQGSISFGEVRWFFNPEDGETGCIVSGCLTLSFECLAVQRTLDDTHSRTVRHRFPLWMDSTNAASSLANGGDQSLWADVIAQQVIDGLVFDIGRRVGDGTIKSFGD